MRRVISGVNLQSNDFELFSLIPQFEQDLETIDRRWKELQRQMHPDNFAAQGSTSQRLAMQWSVRINEAYKRLKNPLKRASYLCELNNAPIEAENNTAMPPAFLIQQMEWRETLDESIRADQLLSLLETVKSAQETTFKLVGTLIDEKLDYTDRKSVV